MKGLRLLVVAAVAGLGVLLSSSAFAQATGDFRSFQNGNWNDVNSWERYNGSTWVNPAPNTPLATEGVVTIQAGDTITVTAIDSIDQLVVDGALALNDTLIITDGTGSDAVVNGTVMMTNTAGRMSLSTVGTPDISFATGSMYVHAANGGEIPTATWATGTTCLITGVTSSSPGNANQDFYNFTWDCAGQSSNLDVGWDNNTIGGDVTVLNSGGSRFRLTTSSHSGTVITINGNVVQSGGSMESTGSSGAATYTIVVKGNVVVTAGSFGVSRGSGGNATWMLEGDLTVDNAQIRSSNSSSRFVFARHDTQNVILSSATYSGSFQYEIDTSTTVVLADGPDGVDWTVNDSLINRGSLVTTGALEFANGSVYMHEQNGGEVPTATWATGSECLITGVTGSAPSNMSQDFYNFVWNCPGQSSNLDWGWVDNTINGNISVLSSGGSRARMTSPGASPTGPNTITVMGTITVDNASFESNGSGSADTITVESHGDISATNGSVFAVSRGSGPMVVWNLYGNLTFDNSETRNSGGAKASFYFAGTGTHHLNLVNPTFGGGGLPTVVMSGATLALDSSVVGGSGAFSVNAGATISSGHASGFGGSLQMTGAKSLSDSANYVYAGTVAQSGDSLLPAQVNRLVINNTAGVTLNGDVSVMDTLWLTNGTLALGTHSLSASAAAGGSATSYVIADGTGSFNINGVGANEAYFPVGTATSFAPAWITNAGTVDTFTVSVNPDDGYALSRVKLAWTIAEKNAGGSNCTLKFGWMGADETTPFAAARATAALIFELAGRTEVGSGTYTRNTSSEPYTVSRGGFTTFGSFAVGDFVGSATAVTENASAIPTVFNLSQNYPNPFNPSTTIKYDIPKASRVSVKIYDALGRVVADLVNSNREPGYYSVEWNAAHVTSGVYFCRIVAGDFVAVRKLLLVK